MGRQFNGSDVELSSRKIYKYVSTCKNMKDRKHMRKVREKRIKSIKKEYKNRKIFRIFIYGKENLIIYKKEIGFIHPKKKETLDKTLKDFMDYNWYLTKDESLIRKIVFQKAKIRKPYIAV